jgi:hypothetical protein
MTVSQLQTPSETIGHRVHRLAREGYGHEDICVILKKEGLRLSPNGKERIRQIVLKRTTALGQGQPPRAV